MTKDVVSWPSPAEQRFRENLQEYQDYLPLTERAQSQLRDDVELLQSQESWDPATQRGIAVWVDDRENIFRFLRVG